MHWTRGCKEIILSIDADTTFLIYDGNGDNDDDYTDTGIEIVDMPMFGFITKLVIYYVLCPIF